MWLDASAERPTAGRGDLRGALSVSVVLPCLNEASSVGLCVQEARTALEKAGIPGEVVVVDNGSSDGTPGVATEAGARVVHEPRRGYGRALLAGFQAAKSDVIVMSDADSTYDLTKIPDLVAPIARNEADLVLGSRLVSATRHTMPWLHRFVGSPALTFLVARACGRRVVSDSQSGFRAFRRESLAALDLRSTGMELATEMLIRGARAGLRITEMQTGYRRRVGESKLATLSDGWRHLKLILLLAPDLILVGPGATLLGLGTALTVISLVQPSGVEVGSLRWQPVFFSGIALVLGIQALLAGAVLAHYSSVTAPGLQRRFAFVTRLTFANRCVALGLLLVAAGLAIDFALFFVWVSDTPPPPGFSYASLAQSLFLGGSSIATFGAISRFLRARAARRLDSSQTAASSREFTLIAESADASDDPGGRRGN